MDNLKLLMVAIRGALDAGEAIRIVYNKTDAEFGVELKEDHSPVTKADLAAHTIIEEALSSYDLPLLSEEGVHLTYDERKTWKRLWIVDPLDGTREFIKRNGEFTVNIALVEDQQPVLGVIYLPHQKVLYFGDVGLGAYRVDSIEKMNDSETLDNLIASADKLPLKQSRDGDEYVVVASRSHLAKDTQNYIDALRQVHPKMKFISVGSSIKMCWMAEGIADCYPRLYPTMEWDTAAGHAILRSVGMDVIQFHSSLPLEYNKENLKNPWFLIQSKSQ